ncbi:MAG: exopolysaccharide biosynthesis protein [Mesorhizobium sp.]|nr:exopolysaccharide biosynthesis protein [Mesorhizobium sp.]
MKQSMGEFQDVRLPADARPPPQRLSAVFEAMALGVTGPITIREIRSALGDRSFATLLILFALFNLLPLPPGASAVLGLPLVIVAAQMVYGSITVWLPRRILDVSLTAEQFRGTMARVVPWLVWLERFIRPRYWPFWPKQGERIVGGIALVLSVVVTLPIPLGNWLPAFAVTLLGFALSERDGILLGIATVIGILSLVVITLVIGSAGALLGFAWSHASMFWPF